MESQLSEENLEDEGEETPSTSLEERLKTHDPAERDKAFKELSRLDENDAFTMITGLFDDGSEEVRNAAARALYSLNPSRAETFTRALREAPPERRRQIIRALDSSGLAAEAIESLAGESREKTYDAFSVLFLMAKAGEVQTLLQTIEKHANSAVRLSVIKLLTFSNRPDIIPALRSLAVRGALPIEVRSALMESIYEISSNARERALSAA
jgi:HEAT repeat protein